MHTKTWRIDVYISEEGDVTHCRAVLAGDSPNYVETSGSARRNPADRQVPEIGDELATARALGALSHDLLELAVRDIEAFDGAPVRLAR